MKDTQCPPLALIQMCTQELAHPCAKHIHTRCTCTTTYTTHVCNHTHMHTEGMGERRGRQTDRHKLGNESKGPILPSTQVCWRFWNLLFVNTSVPCPWRRQCHLVDRGSGLFLWGRESRALHCPRSRVLSQSFCLLSHLLLDRDPGGEGLFSPAYEKQETARKIK